MNLRERLQTKALISFIISIIERLVNLLIKIMPKSPEPINPPSPSPIKPPKTRPIKKIVDTVNNIVPIPWRKK